MLEEVTSRNHSLKEKIAGKQGGYIMKKLTTLLAALFALAMMTGPAIAAEMMGGEEAANPVAGSSFTTQLRKQLSPNFFEYNADGVSDEEFRGLIDKHYGVAPAWEDKDIYVGPLEKQLRMQLSPRVLGYYADGMSDEIIGETIDKHYGVAPAWEDRTEGTLEKELRHQLSPNIHVDETSAF
jgi:hypothetical protein